jgi:transposase
VSKMRERRVKNYELEFKQSSAKLAVTSEQSISQTAKDLGVNVNTLHGWVKAYYPKDVNREVSNNGLEEEVKRLRKENARLRQERDILKKAAAYFANEIS